MEAQIAFQKILVERLTEIRLKNPAYSLRAFAKRTGLTPSTLSEILSGKRRVSRKLVERVARKLCLDPNQTDSMLQSFPAKRAYGQPASTSLAPYTQLNMDHFRVISDWYHFGILSLSLRQKIIAMIRCGLRVD